MLTYLLQKLDEIKRQRNLYCSKDATRPTVDATRPSTRPTVDDAPERALKGKELFLYELICKNLREK